MLVRIHRYPSTSVTSLRNVVPNFDRLFDGFFGGGVQDDGSLFPSLWTPEVDIVEHENEFSVKVELPGVSKDDVKITMQENILTIRGEKKEEKESKDLTLHRSERSYGSFQRSFKLPAIVQNDKIEASYKDGVLAIVLPKVEEVKPKQIEVKVK